MIHSSYPAGNADIFDIISCIIFLRSVRNFNSTTLNNWEYYFNEGILTLTRAFPVDTRQQKKRQKWRCSIENEQ